MVDARSQIRVHLAALRAAGVEFVPRVPPVPLPEPVVLEPVGDPDADRRIALDTLAAEIAGCAKCPELFSTRTQTVFGVGPMSPELCFVGEAPGADEDRIGEPFVGAAGKLLDKIVSAMGFSRDDVYICNTLKCRPPQNATPTKPQLTNCRSYFDRQLELIRPRFLCALGGTAAKHLLATETGITRLRGKVMDYNGIPLVCTYHPSYLLRLQGAEQQKAKAETWDDMKLLLKLMDRPIPGKG